MYPQNRGHTDRQTDQGQAAEGRPARGPGGAACSTAPAQAGGGAFASSSRVPAALCPGRVLGGGGRPAARGACHTAGTQTQAPPSAGVSGSHLCPGSSGAAVPPTGLKAPESAGTGGQRSRVPAGWGVGGDSRVGAQGGALSAHGESRDSSDRCLPGVHDTCGN